MTDPLLSEAERQLWFAWKRAQEVLRDRVADKVRTATGLSAPDVAILIHVADGTVRQNQLASMLGWDRTRLSHHLTRMQTRELVERTRVGTGVEIHLTDTGHAVIEMVRPIHAAAVRHHLIEPFAAPQLEHLAEALERISAPGSDRAQ